MRRNLAFAATARSDDHHARPITCLAFVIFLSVAFWAGAIWMAQLLIRVSQLGY